MRRRQGERTIEEKNIEKVFQRFHLNNYTRVDGSHDDRVERFFGEQLDNYIPAWIEKFQEALDTNKLRFKNEIDRSRFILFFYHHIKRNPDFHGPILTSVVKEVFHKNIQREIEAKLGPLSNEEITKLNSPEWRNKIASNTRVENISSFSEGIISRLAGMQICVASPKHRTKQFIAASKPVVRFEDYPNQELGTRGVEMWTTLTPRLAVGFVAGPVRDPLLKLGNQDVIKMNEALTTQSSEIAGNNSVLLHTLSKKWSP